MTIGRANETQDESSWERLVREATTSEYCQAIEATSEHADLVAAVEALDGISNRTDAEVLRSRALDAAVRRYPSVHPRQHDTVSRKFEERIVDALEVHALGPDGEATWRSFLRVHGTSMCEALEKAAQKLLGKEAVADVAERQMLGVLAQKATNKPWLIRVAARTDPKFVIRTLRARLRKEELNQETVEHLAKVLKAVLPALPESLIAECGLVLGEPRARFWLQSVLDELDLDAAVRERLDRVSEVHATLKRAPRHARHDSDPLGSYGAARKLRELATAHPADWADYLPIALWTNAQAAVQPTLECAAKTPRVRTALRELADDSAPELADRARGLLALIDGTGVERPSREALLRLVQLTDGHGTHPHPLHLRSSTWLGSLELEGFLRTRIEGEMAKWSRELPRRIGRNEEKITTKLLAGLQSALEDATVVAGARDDRLAVTCTYRELSRPEEKKDGADIGLILDVDLPKVMKLVRAEFVQAKKALRKNGKSVQKWGIDKKQLTRLLRRSQTAVYWFYDPEGVIHVVPARLIQAILDGENNKAKTPLIDVGHIRSMAIPISQFIVDLFTGGWLGTCRPKSVAVARGENPDDEPDLIFGLTVRSNHD